MTYGFQTKLQAEEVDELSYSGRGLWMLTGLLVYLSQLTGQLYTVPVGFKTDFASVPRWPVIWLMFGDIARAAAALHDYLYTSHITDRATADALLREAVILAGWGEFRANSLYAAVRAFGASHWNK